MPIDGIVFDMDGVLVDTSKAWHEVRQQLTEERGGTWASDAQQRMIGMSTSEWSRFMAEDLRVPLDPNAISQEVQARLLNAYSVSLSLLPGARESVQRLADQWPLAVVSSSTRELIAAVLAGAELTQYLQVTVSADEVPHGKPRPDIYIEAARRLGCVPRHCVAVEDSTNGILSAAAAEMYVVAVPDPHYPPSDAALSKATVILPSLEALGPELVDGIGTR